MKSSIRCLDLNEAKMELERPYWIGAGSPQPIVVFPMRTLELEVGTKEKMYLIDPEVYMDR